MLTLRKHIREYILSLPKTKRLKVIEEAGLTPEQETIMIRKFVKRNSNVQIALDLCLSVEGVDKNIAKSYDAIIGVINNVGNDF